MKKIVAVFLAVIMTAALFSAFPASAAGEDPDTYFYDTGGNYTDQIGWWLWLNPTYGIPNVLDLKVKFTTPNAFDGFTMRCQSGNPNITIRLLKKSGAVLEELQQIIGEGDITVNFSKAYPAGTYTIQFVADGVTVGYPHFVLMAKEANPAIPLVITGGTYNGAGTYANGAPSIKLRGAVAPEVVDENPDIWFYKDGTVVEGTPDWGLGPGVSSGYGTPAANGYVNVSFFAPSGFSGIGFMYQTYGAANIDAYLLDRDGYGLEYFNINVNSGSLASFNHSFSKTYERGSYILQFADAGTAADCFFWMMKGKANESLDFSTGGNLANNEGIHDGPAIVLYGDEPPVRESGVSLYKQLAPATIGWWMYPDAFANDTEMNITFTAPAPFYGFTMESHASASMSATVKLLDSSNNQLGSSIQTSMAEGTKTIIFEDMYPSGTYTIRILHSSADSQYFVLRAGEKENGINVSVNSIPAGANNTAGVVTDPAPAIRLLGPMVDPDLWLCTGIPYSTGWFIGPGVNASVADGDINVTFTSPGAFRGFKMVCYADDADPAVVQTRLLDKDGNTLETVPNVTITGNHTNYAQGFINIDFSKAYGKGTYTVQFKLVSGSYFVLGSSREEYDADVKVTGNAVTNEATLGAPAMLIFGAAAPRETGSVSADKLNIIIDGGLSNNKACPGDEIDVKIKLANLETISSLKMALSFDEDLSVVTDNGKPAVTFDICDHNPSVRTSIKEATLNAEDGKLILNWMALGDEVIYNNDYAAGEEVVFATVRLKISADAKSGEYLPITAQINGEDVFKGNVNFENIDFKLINGYVDVIEHGHDLSLHYDTQYHWYECSLCDNVFGKEAHTGAWTYDQTAGTRTRTCTVCGYHASQPEKILKFSSVSLSLKESFQINFKANKSVLDEAGYTGLRAEFKLGEKTVSVTAKEKDGSYEFSFSDIEPDRMTDDIQATIYATYGGNEYAGSTLTYRLRDYCDSNLKKTENSISDNRIKLQKLIVDALNYGAAVQNYTDHNTSNLANESIDASLGTQTLPAMQNNSEVKNNLEDDQRQIKWKAVSLKLEDSITMRFGFDVVDGYELDGITVKVTDRMPGEAGANVLQLIDSFKLSGGHYRADFSELNAGQMRKIVYVTAYRGTAQISKTLQYSVESYAFSKSTDAQLGELIAAMIRYGDSAEAYDDMLQNERDLNEEIALY